MDEPESLKSSLPWRLKNLFLKEEKKYKNLIFYST